MSFSGNACRAKGASGSYTPKPVGYRPTIANLLEVVAADAAFHGRTPTATTQRTAASLAATSQECPSCLDAEAQTRCRRASAPSRS